MHLKLIWLLTNRYQYYNNLYQTMKYKILQLILPYKEEAGKKYYGIKEDIYLNATNQVPRISILKTSIRVNI